MELNSINFAFSCLRVFYTELLAVQQAVDDFTRVHQQVSVHCIILFM